LNFVDYSGYYGLINLHLFKSLLGFAGGMRAVEPLESWGMKRAVSVSKS